MLRRLRLISTVLLFLALSASAGIVRRSTSPVTLALTKQFNLTGASTILEMDRARARALIERAKADSSRSQQAEPYNIPVVNQGVYYSTTVGIGNPPRNFSLLIDTGSSNTWVGAQITNFFTPNPSKFAGDLVYVIYGSGLFAGLEYTDTVHLANIPIANQGFGGSFFSYGFGFSGGPDGILGIGPADLTCGSLFPHKSACIPTVTDNAFQQGLIPAHEVGISFAPATTFGETNGELTFGGTDPSKFNGPLTYVPITTTEPARYFVGINQTISYGDTDTVILDNAAGITDTGTTLLILATDAFNRYKNFTGAVMDNKTGLLRVTPEQFGNVQSLIFTIGDTSFEFIPNAQAWPRQLNAAIGGSSNYVYLIVADFGLLGALLGPGISFINGMSFLERFYHVYDATNNRVGFATTNYTYALIN